MGDRENDFELSLKDIETLIGKLSDKWLVEGRPYGAAATAGNDSAATSARPDLPLMFARDASVASATHKAAPSSLMNTLGRAASEAPQIQPEIGPERVATFRPPTPPLTLKTRTTLREVRVAPRGGPHALGGGAPPLAFVNTAPPNLSLPAPERRVGATELRPMPLPVALERLPSPLDMPSRLAAYAPLDVPRARVARAVEPARRTVESASALFGVREPCGRALPADGRDPLDIPSRFLAIQRPHAPALASPRPPSEGPFDGATADGIAQILKGWLTDTLTRMAEVEVQAEAVEPAQGVPSGVSHEYVGAARS